MLIVVFFFFFFFQGWELGTNEGSQFHRLWGMKFPISSFICWIWFFQTFCFLTIAIKELNVLVQLKYIYYLNFLVWMTLIGLIAEKCLCCLCQVFCFFVTQIRGQTRWQYTTKFVACIWCGVGWCWSLISIPHCFGCGMVWSPFGLREC